MVLGGVTSCIMTNDYDFYIIIINGIMLCKNHDQINHPKMRERETEKERERGGGKKAKEQ